MAVQIFHDQVSMKECAERGDRTQGRLHAKIIMLSGNADLAHVRVNLLFLM